ncbi:MAG TPA: DUF5691 domain-containing protein [Polyangiaceae bacterium]|jgi:hypothetical protein
MDPLTRFALLGTTRGEPPEGAGALVDAIVQKMDAVPIERRVLLAAGARAAEGTAGKRAMRSEQRFEGAPPEERAECSPAAARLIRDQLGIQDEDLLREALTLLDRAGRRLPHALLPEALQVRDKKLRPAVRRVLGARGVWLARLNPNWAWATEPDAPASIAALEKEWNDAVPAVRRRVLAEARGLDAVRARSWLEATWGAEKADERAALLAILEQGLSLDDEPFVEAQLRDRSAGVRDAAQTLLARLDASAFVRRMTERADAMLEYRRSMLAALGKRATLEILPPEAVDAAADRDGLLAKPPSGAGARAFWLAAALAAVPPAHWTARFEATAEELVSAATKTDWAAAACEGWTRAALVRRDATWLVPLWDFWSNADAKVVEGRLAGAWLLAILEALPAAEAIARVEPMLSRPSEKLDLNAALPTLPSPWPASLGTRWLSVLRRELQTPTAQSLVVTSLRTAALALPPECLAEALAPFDHGADADVPAATALHSFVETVRFRHALTQEIQP